MDHNLEVEPSPLESMHSALNYARQHLWAAIGLIAVGTIAGLLIANQIAASKKIPEAIAQKVLFTVYAPWSLPPGYAIDPKTYTIKGGALIFAAHKAGTSSNIVFSEQSLPPNVAPDSFYQENLTNIINLQSVPYPSVIGDLRDDSSRRLLGVNAKTTWLLITAPKTISTPQLRQLVDYLKPQ